MLWDQEDKDGEEAFDLPTAQLVDLKLADGEFLRVDWATGVGTSTIDHIIAFGQERCRWQTKLVSRHDAGNKRLSDHPMILAERFTCPKS